MMSVPSRLGRLLPKNRFARSVSVLVGGTVAGQAVIVLASPLLTRLYEPDDLGLLAVFVALLGIITVLASLRYQLAIPLPEEDDEAANVVVLSLLMVLVTTAVTTAAVFLFREPISRIMNAPALADYLWLLPLGVLLFGTYQVFNYWAIRIKAFPAVARTKLTQSVSMVAVQLAGFTLGPISLLIGQVSGRAVGTIGLVKHSVMGRSSSFLQVGRSGLFDAARRYKQFPIYSTWGAAFNTVGTQAPFLLLSASFGAASAGAYLLAHRVLTAPLGLIGKGIADVFFANAATAARNGSLAPLVAAVHERLAQIAMPHALVLVLAGPELFAFVFGQEWRQAGVFAQWMAPWCYLILVTSPLSTLFSVLGRQRAEMVFQGWLLTSRTAALLLGAYYGDLLVAVALFSSTSAFCYVVFLMWIMRASGNTLSSLWSTSLRALVWSATAVSPLVVLHVVDKNVILWSTAFSLSALLVTGRYVFLLKRAWQ